MAEKNDKNVNKSNSCAKRKKTAVFRPPLDENVGIRWKDLRTVLNITHSQLAQLLLDRYEESEVLRNIGSGKEGIHFSYAEKECLDEVNVLLPHHASTPKGKVMLPKEVTETEQLLNISDMTDIVPLPGSDSENYSEDSDYSIENDGICSSPERSTFHMSDGVTFIDTSTDPTFGASGTLCSSTDSDSEVYSDDLDEELSILMGKSSICNNSDDEIEASVVEETEETEEHKKDVDLSHTKEKIVRVIESESDCHQCIKDPAGIVYISCLRSLADLRPPEFCSKCNDALTQQEIVNATAIDLYWVCSNGHVEMRWASQPKIRYGMSVANILLPAAVICTGGIFAKTKLFLEAMSIKCISNGYFHSIQSLVTVPVINTFFTEIIESARERHMGNPIVVMGDGGCDSPGHDAKYCVYTIMEYSSRDILALRVVDKRQTDMKSSNMERRGFQKCMEELQAAGLNVVEVVTDAHPGIAKDMRIKGEKMLFIESLAA